MNLLNPSTSNHSIISKWSLPKGTPQFSALLLLFVINALIGDHFFSIHIQDGRLFGSVIDIFNRGAPVAILTIGMTLVIATGGIDLSVGAVMAISGAVMASMAQQGYAPTTILLCALLSGVLCGLWNGLAVAHSFISQRPSYCLPFRCLRFGLSPKKRPWGYLLNRLVLISKRLKMLGFIPL